MQIVHAAETKPTKPRFPDLYLSIGGEVLASDNTSLWSRNKAEWIPQAAQVLGVAQQQEQNWKPSLSRQSDLLDCSAGFLYSAFLQAPETSTRRLPTRSLVHHPFSQAPPSPAFNVQTAELLGTPGLRSLVLSCGWSQTLACDGAGHQFSLHCLLMGLIPAFIHREVHTIACKTRC